MDTSNAVRNHRSSHVHAFIVPGARRVVPRPPDRPCVGEQLCDVTYTDGENVDRAAIFCHEDRLRFVSFFGYV